MANFNKNEIVRKLRSLGSEKDRKGMARFGIKTENAFGISVVELRKLAKTIGTDHLLARDLWNSGYHEARLLASFIDDPDEVSEGQMERWARAFDSWDLCDQCCGFLFDKTPYARRKAMEWSRRKEEFVKRAGFVLMAALSVHAKDLDDDVFVKFFPRIIAESDDERNFVKKAVNWALRQIGKRNDRLNSRAIAAARTIASRGTRSSKWIAADALRELTDPKTRRRLT